MDTLFDESPAASAAGDGAAADAPRPRAARPLAARMRPAALEDFVGQSHLLGEGSALRTAIEQGQPALDGALRTARLGQDDARADRRRALGGGLRGAERRAGGPRGGARGDRARGAPRARPAVRQTVFFLDEIHRFNKAQQDALLPAVEEGLVTLIGATTENPAFEVNGALLSRLRVYALRALSARGGGRPCCAGPPRSAIADRR